MTEHKILRWAKAYAAAGYNIFPCKPGTKVPLTRNGVLDATNDIEIIEGWFGRREDLNIGLACGPQPNGVNLLAIDVDAHKGGMESWGDLPEIVAAPWHSTPNGGLHIFFDAPQEYRNSRERIGEGIDTRGTGGYVVVPPSSFPVGDETRPYETTSDFALVTHRPLAPPEWLAELLQPQVDPEQRPERHAGPVMPAGDEMTPGDWVRCHGDWEAELLRFGWQHAHGQYWTRPGKSVREGHSAVLHEGGPLVIFTTDVPPELERLGHPTRDRTGIAVSLFELIAAYEFGGDLSAAGREIRRAMPTTTPGPAAASDRAVAGSNTAERVTGSDVSLPNLPDEFWEARPILTHIRDAAWSEMASPDAVLVNVLARTATLVPPTLKLPPVVVDVATFDFFGCVVADTGMGKTGVQGLARRLLPDPGAELTQFERPIWFDQPLGSGEGVVQAFMVPDIRDDENGKKQAVGQKVGRQAVHFLVDEGSALMAMGQRKGTTIIPILLSAWSGAALGQLNASMDTRRTIDPGRVRVTAVMGIQSSLASSLFDETFTIMGLTGRVLFMAGDMAHLPDDLPSWPGPIDFPVPATIHGGELMEYDQTIVDEIRDYRRKAVTRQVVDKETGHSYLLRCKVASLLAIWDGRRNVTVDDWSLAETVVVTSRGVLDQLRLIHTHSERNRLESAAAARGEREYVAENAKERRAIDDLSKSIIAKVPAGGISRSDLRKKVTGSTTRHRFEPALHRAIESGKVSFDGQRVTRGA